MYNRCKKFFRKFKLAINYLMRVLKLLKRAGRIYIILIVFFALIFSVTPSISVLIMKEIINTLQISMSSFSYIFKLLIIYIFIDVVQAFTYLFSQYCESKFQMKGSLIINMSILEKVKEFSLQDFEDSETYDLLKRAMKVDFTRIFSFFKSFVLLIQSSINIILFATIVISWKWWIIPIILIIPLINTIFTAYFGKKQFLIIKNRAGKERKSWYYQYLLTNDIAFKEIKIFNLGEYLRNRYKKLYKQFIDQDINILNKRTKTQTFLLVLEEIINSLILIFIILKAFMGEILLGDLNTYTRSISSVKSYTQNFLGQINLIYENVLYIGQYFEFINKTCSSEILEVEGEQTEENFCTISSIEIKNLAYKYEGQNHYALKELNLKIEGNSLVAFIGVNGSGKSTLVKILSTLYQDYQGDIFFGEHELKTLKLHDVREKIGILYQDFVRYELSARENIVFGSLSKLENSSEIEKIINNVGLKKRINDLDMQLGFWFDDGVQLSGGEWLKVALGRAFIRDAELYILDEPNASLDAISEKTILKAFKELVKGKIGIVVSHRIASIKDIVDKMVVFHNGSIEAIGSHEELLIKSRTYKELFYDEIAENQSSNIS